MEYVTLNTGAKTPVVGFGVPLCLQSLARLATTKSNFKEEETTHE